MTVTAASTLRQARKQAGLTQVQLAARANVAQSVVSAHESSRREPSVEMLRKLIGAAGFELNLLLSPSRRPSRLREAVDRNRVPLLDALQRLGATNVRLFGSVARGDDGPESDIDLLVDLDSKVGLFALGQMNIEAERILGSAVDVVPADSLKSDLVERVLGEAQAL